MATGFVRGFDVGFNAVNSALRLAEMRRDAEHRRKREDEKWGYEKDELERKRTLAADLAAAGDEPTSGMVVGEPGSRNFADSPEEQSFLREQDAAIADLEGRKPSAAKIAVGVGRHILDPSDPRAQSGRRGYMARVASAYRRAGEVDKAINVEDIQREFERTRLKDAAQYLFVSRGDAAGTQRMWEEANGPLGGTLIAEPTVRKGADGTEIPDYTLSIRDEQGNVRPLGSAFTMLYMADNPAEYLKLVQGEQRAATKDKYDAARLALDERRVAVLEQNAQTMERYRRNQMELARAKAGGVAGDLQFTAPSASDQKALRELILESAQDGQDVNVAHGLATRLVMANPSMTMADAARIATTPGVVERPVNTPYGVMPALVTPDGRAVVMAPLSGAMQQGKPTAEEPPKQKKEPSAADRAVGIVVDTVKKITKPSPARLAVDGVNAQFEKETREIEQGKRTDYSPEVKAMLSGDDDAKRRQREAAEQAWLERERARMLNRNR